MSIISLVFLGMGIAIAETESFTVADNDYDRKSISLKEGDEIEYTITVSGGANDDVEFTIYYPDGSNDGGGRISGNFDGQFVAQTSGTYVFEFDNTFSILSNKSVKFSYDITKNTYFVYVDDIPQYAKDYASDAVLDATEYWKQVFPNKNFYVADSESDADIMIQWVKDFTGMSHVGFQYMRLVEIGLGDSNCLEQWNPYSSKHITEIMTHEIGHSIGLEHSNDPNSIMYHTASKTEYGNVSMQFNMGENQGMFIPICMSKEPSSIQFNVETTDPTYGFDMYIVPSKEDFDNILQSKLFVYYSDDECNGDGYLQYSGRCDGTIFGSGLAIIHNSQLSDSTASMTVNYFETEYSGKTSPFETKVYSTIHETATIDVIIFGDVYDFSPSIYQNKDDSIRFEDENGKIIHKYDAESNLGQLFDSFGMSLTNDCFVFIDGRSFCDNDEYSLRFFVNGQERSSLSQYAFNDDDRIKITYDSVPNPQVSTSESVLENQYQLTCGKGTELVNGICQVIKTEEKQKSGGCLIATATYDSELAPQVQQLRELRDSKLLQTESGSSFMNSFNTFYYSFSPTIADWERGNPVFKEAVKITLTPMISSLSILNYVDMDSESEVLGYGLGLIMLNSMMYVGLPMIGIMLLRKIIN